MKINDPVYMLKASKVIPRLHPAPKSRAGAWNVASSSMVLPYAYDICCSWVGLSASRVRRAARTRDSPNQGGINSCMPVWCDSD